MATSWPATRMVSRSALGHSLDSPAASAALAAELTRVRPGQAKVLPAARNCGSLDPCASNPNAGCVSCSAASFPSCNADGRRPGPRHGGRGVPCAEAWGSCRAPSGAPSRSATSAALQRCGERAHNLNFFLPSTRHASMPGGRPAGARVLRRTTASWARGSPRRRRRCAHRSTTSCARSWRSYVRASSAFTWSAWRVPSWSG